MNISPILLLGFLLSPQSLSPGEIGDGWTLKKDAQGIRVYTREVKETGYLEFKGVMALESLSLSSFISIFDDTTSYTRWMYETRDARLLKIVNFHERYTYTIIRASWPFQDRDVVTRAVMNQDPDSRAIHIQMEGASDYFPLQKNCVRISRMHGQWTCEPTEGKCLIITYQMYMEPGGSIPKGLVNHFIDAVPFETLQKFRDVIREERHAKASYPQILETK